MAIILNIVYHLGSFFQHNPWGSRSISFIGYKEGRVESIWSVRNGLHLHICFNLPSAWNWWDSN